MWGLFKLFQKRLSIFPDNPVHLSNIELTHLRYLISMNWSVRIELDVLGGELRFFHKEELITVIPFDEFCIGGERTLHGFQPIPEEEIPDDFLSDMKALSAYLSLDIHIVSYKGNTCIAFKKTTIDYYVIIGYLPDHEDGGLVIDDQSEGGEMPSLLYFYTT